MYTATPDMYSHSACCHALLLLCERRYGFNSVSSIVLIGKGLMVAKTVVNTTISAAIGGISSTVVAQLRSGYIDPQAANNGILSGLVAITASCAVVQPEGALLIGAVAGVIYQGAAALLLKLRIDDVVSACVLAARALISTESIPAAFYKLQCMHATSPVSYDARNT